MRKTTTTPSRTTAGKSTARPAIVFRAIGEPGHNGQCVSEEAIRLSAYAKWEAAGKPAGDGARFWLDAERQLHAVQEQR